MDKRVIAGNFRTRLLTLIDRSRQNRSSFAADIGIDRSALSQLLSEDAVRLPRADTLALIAGRHGVTVDWLLGLSSADPSEVRSKAGAEMAENNRYHNIPLLTRWHAEAAGTKIRSVPHRLPDILRTPAIVEYEVRAEAGAHAQSATEIARTLDFKRRPGTDMEVCLSIQAVTALATGAFPWDGLPVAARREQILHMASMVDALYPSFRIFLFDERTVHSLPYTIFGMQRVAIYGGDMYVVLNEAEAVTRMQRHFDRLIRHAEIQPHDVAGWLHGLESHIGTDSAKTRVPTRQDRGDATLAGRA
jgi:transcriptional regulator with XRE-family HTH domain